VARGKGGRPLGAVALALLAAANEGRATARQLGQRACVGRAASEYTCSRLVAMGRLRVVGSVDVGPGQRGRPAALLELVQASAPDLTDVLKAWRA
jgi:hypothetical protein